MIRPLLALLLLLVPAAAAADDRTFMVGSFDRIRVDGPFDVRIETGRSPSASASADRQWLDRLSVEVNGTTLVVRMGSGGWGETPTAPAGQPMVITLTTPRLVAASGNSGARLTIGRMQAQRIDLAITGTGALAVGALEADQLNATLVGTGTMTLGGHAQRAQLITNGPGSLDAQALTANDLTVRLDGAGETKAAAKDTAQVTNTGLGKVTVLGNAKCTVKAAAGGPVECGPKL